MKLADVITWAGNAAALRLHVLNDDADTSHDGELRPLLEVAVDLADQYLGREFETVPRAVVIGLFEFVRARHQAVDQMDGISAASFEGRGESYSSPSQAARAQRSMEALLYPWCSTPWLKRGPG